MGNHKNTEKRKQYMRAYMRKYREQHPDRIAMHVYNQAIRKLEKLGIDVTTLSKGRADTQGAGQEETNA